MSNSNNDIHANISQRRVVGPVAIGANATVAGGIVDRRGYGGVQFVASYGAIVTTGTVVTLVVKEGDVTGTMTSRDMVIRFGRAAKSGECGIFPI
jgi:hypothetical protein